MGDGCHVLMRNPLLEPVDRDALMTPRNADGTLDEVALHDRACRKIGRLIVEWLLYDRDGNALPLPADDSSVMDRVPSYVLNKLSADMAIAMNPTRPREGPTAVTERTTTSTE